MMKIALYGENADDLSEWKDAIYLRAGDDNHQLDCYTDLDELKENLVNYDLVCMSKQDIPQGDSGSGRAVAFSWGKTIINCSVDDIYYVEAELKDVHIHQRDDEFMVHMSFSQVEKILTPKHFLKIHRSYLVNCQYIAGIENGEVHLKNGRKLPISKYRFQDIKERYLTYINLEKK